MCLVCLHFISIGSNLAPTEYLGRRLQVLVNAVTGEAAITISASLGPFTLAGGAALATADGRT